MTKTNYGLFHYTVNTYEMQEKNTTDGKIFTIL